MWIDLREEIRAKRVEIVKGVACVSMNGGLFLQQYQAANDDKSGSVLRCLATPEEQYQALSEKFQCLATYP